MEKIGNLVNAFLEMLNKILQSVKVLAKGDEMLDKIGDAVSDFGKDVDALKD